MSHATRITDLRAYIARADVSDIADATHRIPAVDAIIIEIENEGGTIGQGQLLSFHYSRGALLGAIADVRDFLVGRDGRHIGALLAGWQAESEYFGQEGLNACPMAAAEVALWDMLAREAGLPIWQLFGARHEHVAIYGSGGWLSYSDEQLIAEVGGYAERGFQAVKIKVGDPDLQRDLHRLELVRKTVGERIAIMMDANQGMNVPAALELARRAQGLGIRWFEEPIDHRDWQGYCVMRQQAGMSLAMGEREYSNAPLRYLAEHGGIDLWQPDLIRIGGVDAWRRSAAIAEHYHIPVLPHYYKDYDVALLCTIERAAGAESFDWFDAFIDEPLRIENGRAYPRPGPGWGFRYRIDRMQAVTLP